ncbi:cation:proton antiporter [Jeotgalibacillus proteolyticus]|uniref:Cation/H(+) antiporter n=1 Tax=Jeotgalibacillus proteolyticus TaxID=2082395 RepID=A0A2S5G9R6_9BACL|nr:cation:proton antiporter [Jeotgalibacillus proteolyticus]PPA69740.1 cation/H(+) antiporter [Jeotgalibacillus proteolyticus]
MTIPFQEPVLVFGLAVIIFLISPILMNKLRIPGIIGPIIAGVIVGPNGFGLLERGETIQLLGTVGLLFIIFIAGLELDIDGFKKYRTRSISFGLLSFFIPLIIGTSVAVYLDFSWAAAILLGSIVGSHTLLAYPIASRLGIAKNKAVTTAIGGTLITDTFAMLILAAVAGFASGDASFAFWVRLIVSTLIFALIVLVGAPYLANWFFRNSNSEGQLEFNFVLTILFVAGSLALFAGLEPIIGAFLSGLALNRYIYDHGPLMNRIRFTGNALFIPFFLLSVGMLMDLTVLFSNPDAWLIMGCIIGAVLIGKSAASLITSRLYHYTPDENKVIIGLTIPQAAATLAATLVGFELGLLDQAIVNAVIVMILLTCIFGPYLTEKFGRRLAVAEAVDAGGEDDRPERILIPIANPSTTTTLLDLGFVVRSAKQSSEPLYPLTVVQKDVKYVEGKVAMAEKMLTQAIAYSSGANVPARSLIKVDRNIGRGIERAVAEERITTIIAGWNGDRPAKAVLFGGIIDNFLDHTNERAMIVKLGHPLNTTERIILILPKGSYYKPGIHDAIRIIKGMASQLNCMVECLIIKDSVERYDKLFKSIKPSVTTFLHRLESWDEMYKQPVSSLRKNDLVVLMSARKGTIAWHPELERVPGKLAKANPESFIIFYPTEIGETDLRGARGTDVPKEVMFRRDYD